MVVSPWILVVVWSVPYLNHSAFSKWVVINTFVAFTVFLVTASISLLIIKVFSLFRWWHYSGVMFCVCLLLYYGFSTFGVVGYSELYHSQTKVVEGGHITTAGHILNFRTAVSGALLSAAVFLVYWFIAVWQPGGNARNS